MTFALTEECLFCHKAREGSWSTLVSVFEVRPNREPQVGTGQVVTVCRECRDAYSVKALIEKAREVF